MKIGKIAILTLIFALPTLANPVRIAPKSTPIEVKKVVSVERTLSIIKPDGVERNLIGKIISRFEEKGLRVIAARMATLSKHEAEGFYAVHKERPFFRELVDYMTSGPVLLMVLEGEGAILKNRDIMGATDISKAAPGTIRKDFGISIGKNTVHGSDSPHTAAFEVNWFFKGSEVGR